MIIKYFQCSIVLVFVMLCCMLKCEDVTNIISYHVILNTQNNRIE